MIEVGEYVRLESGIHNGIRKIVGRDEDDHLLIDISFTGARWLTFTEEAEIEKHSKNIIDLIEDEDIVVLEYKTPKYRERIQRKFIVSKIDDFINFENRHCDFTYKVGNKKIVDKICKNIKIKQILTAEQFNTRCYRLEENK